MIAIVKRALCRAILWLYPPRFRREFGDEWLEVAEWRMQGDRAEPGPARASGRRPARSFGSWLIGETLFALPAAWWAALRDRRPSGAGAGAWATDLRFAARSLRRSPGFVAAVVVTLAIGIGANVGVFTVVRTVLLKPLPYPHADRLVMVWNGFANSGLSRLPLSPAQVLALRDEAEMLEEVGGIWATQATLTDLEEPLLVSMGMTTTNFHRVLGVEPALGRGFDDRDTLAGDGPAVLLSDELWRSAFGADPSIVGRTIAIEGEPTPVVGVLPTRSRLVFPPDGAVPARLDLFMSYPVPLEEVSPGTFFFRVVGRRAPGVSVASLSERLVAFSAAQRERYVELARSGVEVSAVSLHDDAVGEIRPALLALLAGVVVVLLLGCANAAALFTTRLTRRRHTFAMRRCLGASPGRVLRQQLFEACLLSLIAGAVGTLAGAAATRLLWTQRPASILPFATVPVDVVVLGFALLMSLAAGVTFALIGWASVPAAAWSGGGPARGDGLRARTRTAGRALMAAEVGATVVLLVAAVLLARTVAELQRIDPGFEAANQLSFRVPLSMQRFPAAAERARLADSIERQVAALGGVVAVGASSHLPFDDVPNWSGPAAPDGTPENELDAYYVDHRAVTPGYLAAIGARLIDGRYLEEHDDADNADVVVVDRALAERLWPGQRAVGKTMLASHFDDGDFPVLPSRVVGVVETIRSRQLRQPGSGVVFVPFAQSARWQLSFVVRAADPEALVEPIRRQVAALGAGLAAADFRPLRSWMSDAMSANRLIAILAEIFAAIAACLAFAGLYAVISFAVVQRRPEIGVRMALGASRGAIFRLVVGEGVVVGVVGLALGIPAALLVGRSIGHLVFGVDPADPVNLLGVGAAAVLITVAATAFPAWYGARVDPALSLRR